MQQKLIHTRIICYSETFDRENVCACARDLKLTYVQQFMQRTRICVCSRCWKMITLHLILVWECCKRNRKKDAFTSGCERVRVQQEADEIFLGYVWSAHAHSSYCQQFLLNEVVQIWDEATIIITVTYTKQWKIMFGTMMMHMQCCAMIMCCVHAAKERQYAMQAVRHL